MSNEIARLETDKLNLSGGTMTGALLQKNGADIASATTTNLATARKTSRKTFADLVYLPQISYKWD